MEGLRMPNSVRSQTREDTALFEDPLPWYLNVCTQENVKRVSEIEDPIEFADEVYNLVRRVEAAAAKYAQDYEPRVQVAVEAVKGLQRSIIDMGEKVADLGADSLLEKAGKQYLLDCLEWAQEILGERLKDWGYS